jgi:hypothetical protein
LEISKSRAVFVASAPLSILTSSLSPLRHVSAPLLTHPHSQNTRPLARLRLRRPRCANPKQIGGRKRGWRREKRKVENSVPLRCFIPRARRSATPPRTRNTARPRVHTFLRIFTLNLQVSLYFRNFEFFYFVFMLVYFGIKIFCALFQLNFLLLYIGTNPEPTAEHSSPRRRSKKHPRDVALDTHAVLGTLLSLVLLSFPLPLSSPPLSCLI